MFLQGNKPLKRKEESKANQQYEEGHKVQTEDISDSLNQYSHLSDTAVDVWNVIDFFVHLLIQK